MNPEKYILNKKYVNSSIITRLLDITKQKTADNTEPPGEIPNTDWDTAELDEFIKNNL